MEKQKVEVPEGLTARQIEEEYNVSPATAWRASKRGWLYQNYHGDQSGKAVKAGIVQKFKRLVQHPAINMAQLTSLKNQKIIDIISGKSTLREPDWIGFKSEWAEIRNMMRSLLQAGSHESKVERLKTIYHDARIKPHVFFKNKKMNMRISKNLNVYEHEIREVEIILKNFIDKTSI